MKTTAGPEPGQLLADRYRLQERLGDGGHAEVWEARDEQQGRTVALKFLHQRGLGPDEALAVLRHEADMAGRAGHPGVLRVEHPVRDGDVVFLPVEYAAGGDASRLRGASWRRVLPVLRDVADILATAHANGVVHRDLKPRNVLFDVRGNVRLSDFGTGACIGRSDAPAVGSPFSASPQQLRDEPAVPADDVYGLGALAHELLARYPPFYPQFDAARVQVEEPPRPVPSQPAPAKLLDLVQAMLSRAAGNRPDLAQVAQVFQELLDGGETALESGAVAINPASLEDTTVLSMPAKRGGRQAWWLAAAVVLAGALLWWSPKPGSVQSVAAAPVATTHAPASVADAVVAQPVAATAGTVAVPDARPSLDEELHAGEAALVAVQPAQARAAFQRALAWQADEPRAKAGLQKAAQLEALLPTLTEGTQAEAQGELLRARAAYQALLEKDAGFKPARDGLDRVQQSLRGRWLEELLATGAEELRHGRIAAAQVAYADAAQVAPDEPRVREGQQRIDEVLTHERNAADLATGAALEGAERWDEAVTHYQQVLARDATLRFAQDGLARGERRAALDRELRDYLARPDRLTAASVRRAAEQAAARGEASSQDSPRLRQQLRELRGVLASLAVQVRVALTSDNSTRVSVASLGDLGSFDTLEVQLAPGHYTVIGRREGFRDVRYELEIAPGQRDAALSVQCTEPI